MSVNHKLRHLAKFNDDWPSFEDMVQPDVLDTTPGDVLKDAWERAQRHELRMQAFHSDYVDTRELTLREYRAFRKLGGQSA